MEGVEGAHLQTPGAPPAMIGIDGDAGGEPGTVTEIGDDHFVVAAGGGSIKVMRVRPHDDGKLKAPDYVAKVGLTVGTVLGG